MKKNVKNVQKSINGITLIALVVTIIVLLILAGVSIAMLTGDNGIITNTSKSAVSNAYYGAEEQVKLAHMAVMSQIMAETVKNGKYDATTPNNTKKLAQIVEKDLSENKWFVDGTEASKIKIRYKDSAIDQGAIDSTSNPQAPIQEGQVDYLITLSGQDAILGTNVEKIADLDDKATTTPEEVTIYYVGDTVTLGGETFYVIEDSYEDNPDVKLITALFVKTTEGEGQYTQTSDANKLVFGASGCSYDTSNVKGHVGYYKTALESRMGAGITIKEARLMSKSEINALGEMDELTYAYSWPDFITTDNYWLGYTTTVRNVVYAGAVTPDSVYGDVSSLSVAMSAYLRPVIVVEKTMI